MTTASVPHMFEMGLTTSVVAPLLVWRIRRLHRLAVPGVLALPLFVAVHDGIVIWMGRMAMSPAWSTSLHLLLLAVAVVFWLPVVGTRRRLPDPGRVVYLSIALPMLDLSGVYEVLAGDQAGGLSMIVAMLPAAVIAVGIAWRWLLAEERAELLRPESALVRSP